MGVRAALSNSYAYRTQFESTVSVRSPHSESLVGKRTRKSCCPAMFAVIMNDIESVVC